MSRPVDQPGLPEGLLLAYYGDDFTGSTDVMEVMAFSGLPTVLFLQPPSDEQLAQFDGVRAVGVAGTSRGESPAWMDGHLPDIFRRLACLGTPILQYKVCSTFDSSPQVGPIGRALEIGLGICPPAWSPMVVAAPRLRRFQAFGNLFATVDGVGYRLDRHPTMSRHPVTPMTEADLRLHLAAQTGEPIGLIHLADLKAGWGGERRRALEAGGCRVILIDVIDDETLIAAGRLVWEGRGDGLFSVSSSGLQYALTAYWRAEGLIAESPPPPALPPAERIAVVSGSCSPETDAQIAWSSERDSTAIRLDAARIVEKSSRDAEIGAAVERSLQALGSGRNPIVYAARGPDDPAIARSLSEVKRRGGDPAAAQAAIGSALGAVLDAIVRRSGLRRAVIAGGDTSGRAAAALGIYALQAAAPVAPGSPLCLASTSDPALEGLEIALKGGQVGAPDYFALVQSGGKATGL